MAEAAIIPPTLIAYTNSNWNEEPFAFYNGALASPDDFTGASAKMGLRAAGSTTNALELTTGAGTLTITLPNEIGITVPAATMATLTPGPYAFDMVVTYGSGDVETLLAGQVEIRGGLA